MNKSGINLLQHWGVTLTLKLDKIKIIAGFLLSIVTIWLCIAAEVSFAKICLFVLVLLALSLFSIECNTAIAKVLTTVWIIGSIPASLILTQLMMNSNISVGALRITLGLICCGIVLICAMLISFSQRISVVVCITALLLLTTVNYFVLDFKGCELAPADILAFSTAMEVAGQFTYRITPPFAYAWIIGFVYCFCGWCIPKLVLRRTARRMFDLVFAEFVMTVALGVGLQNIVPEYFAHNGSAINGFLVNFVARYEYSAVEKPDTYDLERLKSYESQYQTKNEEVNCTDAPNIIMIMCETFADLRVLGELNTTAEVMPFYDSLQVDTIRGQSIASVFGGATCNSEYEVLSGNSMAFFPRTSYPYQQYIKNNCWSLVSYLESMGYRTLATHPENGGNWMRTTAYPLLGFDEMYFLDDYPQENLLRGHVSDQEMYEQMIAWYEEKSGDDPLFMFGITMQNHSGYLYEGSDFSETVFLEGYSGEYPDVEQYLTLLQHSDAALEYLVRYFEGIEDDVIIVFFGDHFPRIDTEFYRELHGGGFDSLETQMLQYTVPFCIWANYDIEEQYIETTSLNFLSTFVLEAAELPLSPYHSFLFELRENVPAINSFGYFSNYYGEYVPLDLAEGSEAEWLSKYEELQYNSLFDADNRSTVFFPTY